MARRAFWGDVPAFILVDVSHLLMTVDRDDGREYKHAHDGRQ
jgi:hypothetical protein